MSGQPGLRILIGLGIAVLTIWLAREVWGMLATFAPVLALFFSAWLISFVLSPPTDALVRARVSRPLAVLIVYCLVMIGMILAILLLTPLVAGQLGQLLDIVNSSAAQTPAMLTWIGDQARAWGITEEELRDLYRSGVDQVRSYTGLALQNALGWVTGAASALVNVVFCLIISVYIMLDGRRILAGSLGLVPRRYRAEARVILQSIGDNFGGYIRGQLILAVVYAAGVAAAMTVARLDYRVLCSIFAGVAMLIPFIGPFISILPPLLIAFFANPSEVWWIALLLLVVQQAVLNAVGPRVLGHTVNMHPLLVIGAALTGATVAGVWGALFGIPVAGIIASVLKRLYQLRQQSEADQADAALLADEPPVPAGAPDAVAAGPAERPGADLGSRVGG